MAEADDEGGAPTRVDEIERLAALALAPLVEVAWADGRVTPAERQGVLEAARLFGLRQRSPFCRSTLLRWLQDEPPTDALHAWRRMLAPTLAQAHSRSARESERRLLAAAEQIAQMDSRDFVEGDSIESRAGITPEEQRVLDDLAAQLDRLRDDPSTT